MYCERQINQESGIFSPSSLRKPQQYFEDKRTIQACFADWVSKLGQKPDIIFGKGSYGTGERLNLVQRKINYESLSKRVSLGEGEKNLESLISKLQDFYSRYGMKFKEKIRGWLEEINVQSDTWTLGDILKFLDAKAKEEPIPIAPTEKGIAEVRLPFSMSAQRDFAFPSHTRAVAVFGQRMFEEQSSGGVHAEEQIVTRLQKLEAEVEELEVRERKLSITINNFPCLERCTPQIITLTTIFTTITIYYVIPYGGENFEAAARKLKSAGINLIPIDPRDYMTPEVKRDLTTDQAYRFEQAAKRRTLYPLPK